MKFRFAEEEDACEYVTHLSADLRLYRPAHVLKARLCPHCLAKWSGERPSALRTDRSADQAIGRIDRRADQAIGEIVRRAGQGTGRTGRFAQHCQSLSSDRRKWPGAPIEGRGHGHFAKHCCGALTCAPHVLWGFAFRTVRALLDETEGGEA